MAKPACLSNTMKEAMEVVDIHFYNNITMKDVKELVSRKYCIKQMDDTIEIGEQKTGDIFVFVLNGYFGKVKRGDSCRARVELLEVLVDGRINEKIVETFIYEKFCEALEENLKTKSNVETQTRWFRSIATHECKEAWVVLHRPYIKRSRIFVKHWHPFTVVLAPPYPPGCHMWLMLSVQNTTSSFPTVSHSRFTSTHNSLSSINLEARITVPLHQQHSPRHPSTSAVLSSAKQPMQRKRPPKIPSKINFASSVMIKYRPKSLVNILPNTKASVVGVVLEVVNEAQIYDIIKITDIKLRNSTKQQNSLMVKIFHNGKYDWPEDVKPERGQVMVFKDMLCVLKHGQLEGVVYTTKMICVCKYDESHITWYCHNPENRNKIENGDQLVQELFDWWKKENLRGYNVQPAGDSVRNHHVCSISKINDQGCYTIKCQVVKKTIYHDFVTPKVVLRVCDGTPTSFKFEEIYYDPTKDVGNIEHKYGNVGSVEVDIVISSNILRIELEELQVGSFVALRDVYCVKVADVFRKLVFIVGDNHWMDVLQNDDGSIMHLKESVQNAREQKGLPEVTEGKMDKDSNTKLMEECSSLHTSNSCNISEDLETIENATPTRNLNNCRKLQINSGIIEASTHTSISLTETSTNNHHPQYSPSQPVTSKQCQDSLAPQLNTPRKKISHFPQFSTSRQIHVSSYKSFTSKESPHTSPSKTPSKTLAKGQPQQDSPQVPLSKNRKQVQQSRGISMKTYISDQPNATSSRELKFYTEVIGKGKETNLESFILKSMIGEVHQVKAVITNFKVITANDCILCSGTDQLCLHQWVWGRCQRCNFEVPSIDILKNSAFDVLSSSLLPCENCYYRLTTQKGRQPQDPDSHHLAPSVMPFIKVKVVVKDIDSRFQLTPWLTAEDANSFFGVKPTFLWVIQNAEILSVVEQLLQENCSLLLGMVKKNVGGRVDSYIVNTTIHYTPTHLHNPESPSPSLSPSLAVHTLQPSTTSISLS